MNSTLNWAAVASTTGNLVNASVPYWELYTGIFLAFVAVGGIIVVVIRSFSRIKI